MDLRLSPKLHSLTLFSFAWIAACAPSSVSTQEHDTARLQKVQAYLESAPTLTDDQRLALSAGRPFIGMSWEEANLAMKYDSTLMTQNEIPVVAVFRGAGTNYVLYFDGKAPNRVTQWSLYTPKEVDELRKFPDRYPWPPVSGIPR